VRRIVKVYGAVQHPGELPGSLHNASVEAIRSSGLEWALLSPTSVLETSLLPMTRWIEHFGAMVASAGEGKVALVAADDVARAGAVILAERDENERDYVITGPELLTLGEISEIMSRVTGRSIPYTDVSDDELAGLQDEPSAGRTAQNPEIAMFFRAWRNGGGEARTDTFHELTGRAVTTTEEWIIAHCELFVAARDRAV
jgi:uncharacterized protein YbjT (DUF2867 family)